MFVCMCYSLHFSYVTIPTFILSGIIFVLTLPCLSCFTIAISFPCQTTFVCTDSALLSTTLSVNVVCVGDLWMFLSLLDKVRGHYSIYHLPKCFMCVLRVKHYFINFISLFQIPKWQNLVRRYFE